MLIFKPAQPINPVTTKIGNTLGTSVTAANIGLRKATSIISPIPAVATPNAAHWSRSILSIKCVKSTKNPVTSAPGFSEVSGNSSREIVSTWRIMLRFCADGCRSLARSMIR